LLSDTNCTNESDITHARGQCEILSSINGGVEINIAVSGSRGNHGSANNQADLIIESNITTNTLSCTKTTSCGDRGGFQVDGLVGSLEGDGTGITAGSACSSSAITSDKSIHCDGGGIQASHVNSATSATSTGAIGTTSTNHITIKIDSSTV